MGISEEISAYKSTVAQLSILIQYWQLHSDMFDDKRLICCDCCEIQHIQDKVGYGSCNSNQYKIIVNNFNQYKLIDLKMIEQCKLQESVCCASLPQYKIINQMSNKHKRIVDNIAKRNLSKHYMRIYTEDKYKYHLKIIFLPNLIREVIVIYNFDSKLFNVVLFFISVMLLSIIRFIIVIPLSYSLCHMHLCLVMNCIGLSTR